MITLELTHTQIDEIIHCLRTSYMDYDERLGVTYNTAVESYNDQLDEIINAIKLQVREQEV